jgi:hypothetical protein
MKRWFLSGLCALLGSLLFLMTVMVVVSGMWGLIVLWMLSGPENNNPPNGFYFLGLVIIAAIALHRWVFKGKK